MGSAEDENPLLHDERRDDDPEPDNWELPTGLPKGAVRAARQTQNRSQKAT